MPSCSDWIIFGLGVLVTVGWALLIYCCLRPDLLIEKPSYSIDENCVRIPISNISKYRKATRLVVEVAIVYDGNTKHFTTDFNDYAFLPEACSIDDSIRIFKANTNEYNLDTLNTPNSYLRVRVHATDSFSGLGKTFQVKYTSVNGDFKKYAF
jgi:hypothetical protein